MKDEEIIILIIQGKSELYSILIDRYSGKIFSTAYSYTHNHEEAKDLVQEIFIKVYKNLMKFKAESKFSTWLYRVAVNSCIDWNRRYSGRVSKIAFSLEASDIFDDITDEKDGPEQTALNNEHKELIRSIVKQMPEIYKTVLILYYFEDLKVQEISNILNCPRKTVETRLYRAKGILKSQFEQELSGGELYELQSI